MQHIKAIIADDETLSRDIIKEFLRKHPAVKLVAECTNGIEAVNGVTEHQPDVLFLDIQMPDLDGFDTLKELDAANLPLIVFTTAYDKYALKAFEASAIDYLLKPFDQERFDIAVERARKYMQHNDKNSRETDRQRLLSNYETVVSRTTYRKPYLERLLVKENKRIVPVFVNDVDVFEADNDYVRLHRSSGTGRFLINNSLSNLESLLNPYDFVRIHKSFIIKINAIAEMKPHTNGEFKILMKNGMEVKLSRTYKDAVKRIGGSIETW
jgi:two-component system LytT family response regulator